MSLQQIINQEMRKTEEAVAATRWAHPEIYGEWLSQTFHFVSHTTRLLALAAGEASLAQQNYHEQFLFHLKEEHGHDKLALSDLKALGLAPVAERRETQEFYRAVYHSIRHNGAVGLFGYMMFLESVAIHLGPQWWQEVTQAYGKKAGRFLAVHVHEDVEHVAVTLKTLEKAPAADQQQIITDLKLAGHNYRAIWAAVAAHYKERKAA